MSKHDDEDDDDNTPLGAWVVATYHCYYSVEIHFVVEVDGRPAHDWGATSSRNQCYRWQSYHAARKFQRAHRELRGYVILNLAAIEQQCAEQRRIRDERVASMTARPVAAPAHEQQKATPTSAKRGSEKKTSNRRVEVKSCVQGK